MFKSQINFSCPLAAQRQFSVAMQVAVVGQAKYVSYELHIDSTDPSPVCYIDPDAVHTHIQF